MNSNKVEFTIKKLKKKVTFLLEQKSMTSIMNNTKWLELQRSVIKLPFLPPYEIKCVTDTHEPEPFDKDVCYTGNWDDELLLPLFNIEWIKVRPRYIKDRGYLIDGEIVDETEMFIDILEKHSIPYEEENGAFIIYGYRKL
ncbi:DUF6678 family protein [Clostridium sp. BSD9I1]|uniref:DUF6678 family protein n=1 Tax=Clostridium sp. BSD9I1 TaxID=2003589 RepID=UPI0016470307|nr:DUF6678 family protein [Clostridium sp. BSD9I1]